MEIKDFMDVINKLAENGNEKLLKEIMGSVSPVSKNMPGYDLLIKAQNIINYDGMNSDVYYDKPYLVTTRNQRYINKTLPEGASSACIILSAADTLFELISRDVKNIVALDINELQTLIYKLRRASILTLSAKDFENFLINPNSSKFMSIDVFKTVKNGFDQHDLEGVNVWEQLLSINPKEDLEKHFFKGIGGDVGKTVYSLPYLKRKVTYYELRDKLEKAKITIKLQSALDYLTENSEQKFDYIDITNILLFVYQLECKDNQNEFYKRIKTLKDIYRNNLNNGGTFVLDYLFGMHIEDLNNSPMSDQTSEYIRQIYQLTYQKLNDYFDLESINAEKLIDGFGPKSDTVIFTKKPR